MDTRLCEPLCLKQTQIKKGLRQFQHSRMALILTCKPRSWWLENYLKDLLHLVSQNTRWSLGYPLMSQQFIGSVLKHNTKRQLPPLIWQLLSQFPLVELMVNYLVEVFPCYHATAEASGADSCFGLDVTGKRRPATLKISLNRKSISLMTE